MSRLLLALAILLIVSSCNSFTLIGSVNLGGPSGGQEVDVSDDPGSDKVDQCWPSAKAAVAEMRRHGYTKEKWTETAEWFTKLEPVKNSLPPCPS